MYVCAPKYVRTHVKSDCTCSNIYLLCMYIYMYIYISWRMDQRYGTKVWNKGMERILQTGMELGYGTGVWNGCGPGPCSGPYNLTCTHLYWVLWVFVHKQHSIHCDTNLGEVRVPRLHTIEVGLEPQPIGKILLTWRTFLLFIIEGNELNFWTLNSIRSCVPRSPKLETFRHRNPKSDKELQSKTWYAAVGTIVMKGTW